MGALNPAWNEEQTTEREMASYAERTKASQAATERARKVMPAGVPSSVPAPVEHPDDLRNSQPFPDL